MLLPGDSGVIVVCYSVCVSTCLGITSSENYSFSNAIVVNHGEYCKHFCSIQIITHKHTHTDGITHPVTQARARTHAHKSRYTCLLYRTSPTIQMIKATPSTAPIIIAMAIPVNSKQNRVCLHR